MGGNGMKAMIHSKQAVGEIEILERHEGNDYTEKTEDGIVCSAIFNGFNGLYYADDVYGIREAK
jgi:hypothetical protein